MRKTLLSILLAVTTIAVAQTQQELRDSLKLITQQSSFAPDSIDLRLKKASYNVMLEQWEYAKNEYDYVLNREPLNTSMRGLADITLQGSTIRTCLLWCQETSRHNLVLRCSTRKTNITGRQWMASTFL